MRLANEAIAKRIVAKVRDHSPVSPVSVAGYAIDLDIGVPPFSASSLAIG
jgi:hypothetical protein